MSLFTREKNANFFVASTIARHSKEAMHLTTTSPVCACINIVCDNAFSAQRPSTSASLFWNWFPSLCSLLQNSFSLFCFCQCVCCLFLWAHDKNIFKRVFSKEKNSNFLHTFLPFKNVCIQHPMCIHADQWDKLPLFCCSFGLVPNIGFFEPFKSFWFLWIAFVHFVRHFPKLFSLSRRPVHTISLSLHREHLSTF